MSQHRSRNFVLALLCSTLPLLPSSSAQAAGIPTASASAVSDANLQLAARLNESGPPVMQQAAQLEATAAASTFAPIKTAQVQTHTNTRLFREVFGFAFASSLGDPTIGYPSWNFALLSTVAYFGLHVAWDGSLVNDSAMSTWNNSAGPVPDMISTAHANGTKIVVTIIMMDSTAGTPNMCSALRYGSVTIQQTVAQVRAKGIDGVNVDYESNNSNCFDSRTGLTQSSQSLFTSFVHNLRAALPSGSYLSVDTYSGSAGYRNGSTYLGFFDIGALASSVDAFFVMAYDMEYSNWSGAPLYCRSFCIGPTAPLSTYLFNDGTASSEYRAVVPASKVIMGIPYYGRKVCVAGVTPTNAPPNAIASSSAGADGYLDASTENGYVANSNYQTHRETRDSLGGTRWDTFTSSTASCTRELYWDDVTALGNKYNLIIRDGLRGAGIFALNYGGGAPELWSLINLKFGQCSNATLAADSSSPQIPGTTITLTGGAFCAGTPDLRFWSQPPGGAWSVVQDYSTATSAAWDSTGKALGTYQFEADARNLGSSVAYDTVARLPFRLALCVTPTLSSDVASPELPGTAVTFTAVVTCRGTPQYRFWVQPPGGSWAVAQDYGNSSTFRWDTSHSGYGDYKVEVDARAQGTAVSYESVQVVSYTLSSCISVALAIDKTSPQPTGSQVALSGTATCVGAPQYRFMVMAPSGVWSVVQDFGGNANYNWSAGGPGGDYQIELDARGASAPVSSLSSATRPYVLTSCGSGALTTDLTSPQVPGASIILTGSAACDGIPQYRFLIRSPGGAWTTVHDYGSPATYTWNTTGLPNGDYGLEVDARNAGATSSYETTASVAYTLASPACTSPTLAPDVASPQATGSVVNFTATSSVCPNPVYRFWVQPPGGAWTIAQDYGAAAHFAWLASGVVGTWGIEVDVRDVSRPVPYDLVANATYALTGCSAAALSTDLSSPQSPGAVVTLTGSGTCPRPPQFRFWVKAPGARWSMAQDYGSSSTYAWHTPMPGGTWQLEVDVRDQGAATAYETTATANYAITAPCAAPSVSPSLGSPLTIPASVTLSAATSGCPTPQYRFWVRPPGGAYVVSQDYGAAAAFTWNTAGLAIGMYAIEVDVRNQGSVAAYQGTAVVLFTLTSPPCSSPTLTASPSATGGTGATVTFTGTAAGCPVPQFRFWVQTPGSRWSMVRDYTSSPTFAWTGTAVAGVYHFETDVRVMGSSVSYDAVANSTYTVVGCSAGALAADHTSPQPAGTTITLTGSATCLGTPEYRFWIRKPGGSWTIVRDYGASASFAWNTAGSPRGTYQLEVDVRNQGSSASYETVANKPFAIG